MEPAFQSLLESFYQITGKLNKMRYMPIRLGGAEPLNTPAIHLIDMVGKHPEYNATQLAQALGNTKGAISQMTAKLEHRGFLQKCPVPGSEKEVTFQLTEVGWQVYCGHEQLHAALYERLEGILSEFSPADVEKMQRALHEIDAALTEYEHI